MIGCGVLREVKSTFFRMQSFYEILRGDPVPCFLLRNLRTFWATHKDFWFSHATIDSWEITHTTYKDDLDTNMHLLLHYDQICRHPGNLSTEMNINKPLAFRFATALALHMIHCDQYTAAAPWERVFILLALRHNDSLKSLALRKCLQEAETDPRPLWCRFLNATVWDVHCWQEQTVGYPAEPTCDLDSLQTFSHLLESPRNHAVRLDAKEIEIAIQNCIAMQGNQRVAVSISGGVDSMVAATVAAKICTSIGKELVLLHISYKNRAECEDECNLLRWWAQQLGVPLYIRRITEIQRVRNSGLRTVYEEVTRRIRFAFYRWFRCPVILGHNLDDCYENVFSNLSKQIHFENLFGMSDVGEEQGVQILRPLLEIPKAHIVAYADQKSIPHLYDSTPAWSRRGQMRDRLLPGIRDFDAGILEGLKAVVERTRFLEAQWDSAFCRWCEELHKEERLVTIPRDEFLNTNKAEIQFWVRIFQYIEWPRPSNKSLKNFMEMIDRRMDGMCTLSGDLRARFTKDSLSMEKVKL